MVVGGWANPLQTLSQGLVLTLRFTFGPELDNLNICWPRPWAATRNGVRPGLVSGKVKMGL